MAVRQRGRGLGLAMEPGGVLNTDPIGDGGSGLVAATVHVHVALYIMLVLDNGAGSRAGILIRFSRDRPWWGVLFRKDFPQPTSAGAVHLTSDLEWARL